MIGLAGLVLGALWATLAGWVFLMAAGAAGVGIDVRQTQLPLLLVGSLAASLLMVVAVLWRPAAVGVVVAGVALVVVAGFALRDWHPDYRPMLTAVAALALLAAGWGVAALVDQAGSARSPANR